jgi:sec-independent protein translocase protein TatA
VLFGGSQLPKLAKNLGKAQQEFKSGLTEGQKEAEREKSAGGSTSTGSTDVTKIE